jgi:IclR family transcriptional regulator, KDG regulon repressor
MTKKAANRYAINSILRADSILRLLAREPNGLRVGEVATRLELDRTTVFRLFASLEEIGYIERIAESKAYKLGVGIYEIGSAYIRSTDLYSIARPVMIELSQRVKEAVHWAILSGEKAVCIDKIDSPRGLGTTSKIGRAVSLNSGSVGKVLLAYQGEEARKNLLRSVKFKRFTDQTIVSEAAMREAIGDIRGKGYCISLGEGEPDMACIAAPIFDHNRQVIAGLSIGGPIHRFTDLQTTENMSREVRQAAREISDKLGCPENPPIEDAA